MRIVRLAVRSLAWVVSAVVVVVPLASPGGPLSLQDVAMARPAMSITGSITDLRPGHPSVLTLTLSNAGSVDAVVHTVSARVTAASAGCSTSALHVQPWRGLLTVPGKGEARVALPLRLDADAADCGAAVWQLDYSAS